MIREVKVADAPLARPPEWLELKIEFHIVC